MRRWVWVLLVALALCWTALAEEKDHADHEDLRALLHGVEQAMNSQKYSDLLPYFHDRLRVTMINQEVVTQREGLEPYFKDWIGPGKYVKNLTMKLTADDLTEFYGSGESRFGVVRGAGTEDYDLTDGRRLEMKTRWTATVVKEQGKWRILTLHIGANFYRNPIVEQFQKAAKTYAMLGLAAGAVGGALLTWLVTRRK
jgi:hypothetical protein